MIYGVIFVNFKWSILFILILGLPIITIVSVSAAEITVTGNSFSNIQSAVSSANNGDVIKLNSQTYSARDSDSRIRINDKRNLVIQGPSSTSRATLDGRNLCRMFTVTNTSTVTFKYINFLNGNSSTNSGGAIFSSGRITVDSCNFRNNKGESGGTIFLSATASNSVISNCQFIGSKGIYPSTDNFIEGGAIDSHASYVTVKDCLFESNTALNAGGALNFATSIGSQVINSNFTSNSALTGGALRIASSSVVIQNCNFNKNSATDGGAINSRDSNVTVLSSNFNDNIASSRGGGIFSNIDRSSSPNYLNIESSNFNRNLGRIGGAIFSNTSLNVVKSVFNANKACIATVESNGAVKTSVTSLCNGGAIYADGKTSITSNSKFVSNSAYNGGVIYSNNVLNIVSSTFDKNTALQNGGVIYVSNALTVSASIFSNNKANNNGGAICAEGITSITSNSKFISNSAYNGGVIYSNNVLNIVSSTFDKNTASRSGGAIYASNALTVSSSIFSNNKANNNGGAICTVGVTIVKDKSSFVNNIGEWGSAIFSNNELKIYSTSFSKNKAKSKVSISLPNGIRYNDLTKIKVILEGNDNIKSAIWHDKLGNVYIDDKKQIKSRLLSNKVVIIDNKLSVKTNSKGEVLINYKGIIPSTSTTKNYMFKANFKGDTLFYSSTNTIKTSIISKLLKKSIWNVKTYKLNRYIYKVNKNGWYAGSNYNSKTKNWKWTKLKSKPGSSGKWINMTLSKNNKWVQKSIKAYTKTNYIGTLVLLREVKDTKASIIPHTKNSYQLTSTIMTESGKIINKVVKNQDVFKQGSTNLYFLKESNISSNYSKYLISYNKAPTNNPVIRARVINILSSYIGEITPMVKANLIFNWVRDKIAYPKPMYFNTKKMATGTLSSKVANCVDQSHLVVAMLRMVKVPAMYQNSAACKFSSGAVYGHCWAKAYVGGKWYQIDTTGRNNGFGVINNFKDLSGTNSLITTSF